MKQGDGKMKEEIKEMSTKVIEKDGYDILLTLGNNALNRLLFKKGIITQEELNESLYEILKEYLNL